MNFTAAHLSVCRTSAQVKVSAAVGLCGVTKKGGKKKSRRRQETQELSWLVRSNNIFINLYHRPQHPTSPAARGVRAVRSWHNERKKKRGRQIRLTTFLIEIHSNYKVLVTWHFHLTNSRTISHSVWPCLCVLQLVRSHLWLAFFFFLVWVVTMFTTLAPFFRGCRTGLLCDYLYAGLYWEVDKLGIPKERQVCQSASTGVTEGSFIKSSKGV